MKLNRVVFQPKAEIEFSRADVRILMELSERHYDSVCKSLGEQGGLLYGMRNELKFCSDSRKKLMIVSRTLTNDQVQLLCKLCEMAPYFMGNRPSDKRKREYGTRLGSDLWLVLREMDQEFDHIKQEAS